MGNINDRRDPIAWLEVPETEQLDVDTPESTHALTGGDDTEGLDEIRKHPGRVVPEEELQ